MQKTILRLTTILLILFLLGGLNGSVTANSSDTPERVHLTWQSDDTAHTMTITWWTPTKNTDDNVLYDTVSRDGAPENYAYSENGSHHTFTNFNGYIHDVELTNLSPDTTYYFICGGENGGYSQEWSFQTAPTTSENLKFAAGGDSRPLHSGEARPSDFPENRDLLSQEMATRNPAFAIYTGGFVLDSDSGDQWENWFDAMQKYWVTSENRMIPIIPTIGNHEITYPQPQKYSPKNDAPYYYEQFALPENERWYSLDWGPDLHITILDSEILDRDSKIWNEQKSWLEDDLSQHEDFRWKIVAFHRPPPSVQTHLTGAILEFERNGLNYSTLTESI
ncbi:hypothetical protein AKJ44_00540 [candidate division MSBL1 archaeon SCGC-AAA261F17]|uniref:Fibronectin type-III domain-containing protein n=1 Tax=candidate division MSBL1 archaeon SCGC-AAA261F17 TaxID=1698274 RepID=A0A133V7I0_9EURY|nr:hypothetical protein AKJ44_00540 [candidate division MSBL1 archaeon SCGC-AAA261F17]